MKVERPTSVAARPRKRILVIEDDHDLAQLYRGVLRFAGFDALHVADGWAALRVIEDERPDLLVVDVHLPGLRGDELLKELSTRPETRPIPAIVVTGSDVDFTAAEARQVLRKPCPPDRLVSAVERYLEAA